MSAASDPSPLDLSPHSVIESDSPHADANHTIVTDTRVPTAPTLTPNSSLSSPLRKSPHASTPTSATTTPTSTHQRSESHTPSDGIKSKLLSHVENRPDREQLMKRNIMKAYDSNTDPKLQGVMSSLIKTQTEDRLAQSLNKRRSVQELVAQGIMMDRSKGTISVQLAQRAILRQMERDRLSAFLTKRPTLDELVKTKSNIMEDTMTWVKAANLTGSIPLPRNCLSEDTRILTADGFMFLDQILSHKSASGPRYACFNPTTRGIEYHTGELLIKEQRQWDMVEFTNAESRHTWSSTNDEVTEKLNPIPVDEFDHRTHTSLLVTADHDMYVALNSDTHPHPHHRHRHAYSKVPASRLLSSKSTPSSSSIRMLAHAASGIHRSPSDHATLVATICTPLQLEANHIESIIKIYGMWIAYREYTNNVRPSSSHSCSSLPLILPFSPQLIHLLSGVGLVEDADWRRCYDGEVTYEVMLMQRDWIELFCVSSTDSNDPSLDRVAPWIHALLDPLQLRSFFDGIFHVPSSSSSASTDSIVGQRMFRTTSHRIRDELVHAALLAGFAAHFTTTTDANKNTTHATTNTSTTANNTALHSWRHASWTVVVLDPSLTCTDAVFSRAPSSASSDVAGAVPSSLAAADLRRVSNYVGRVWCVTVPTGLIMVQRAEVDTHTSCTTQQPVVTRASRTLITGNCHTMTSFTNSNKMYLLGGYGTGSTTNSDLLILDTSNDSWFRPPVGGSIPCERYSHTCCSLGNDKLIVFGGFSTNGVWLNDVYVLDTQVAQSFYTKLPYPSSTTQSSNTSTHHSPILGPINQQTSTTTQMQSNQSSSHATNASLTSNTNPNPVTTSRGVPSQLNSSSPSFQPLSSHPSPIHVPQSQLSTVSMLMWQQPLTTGTPPAPRAAHGTVVVGDRVYIFGGNDGETLFNDLYVLDTLTWSWSCPLVTGQQPSPRAGHTMNLVNGRYIVVFGGGTAAGPVNDLYVLDVGASADSATSGSLASPLTWSKPKTLGTPPSPRAGHSSCRFFASQLLVFGGGYLNKVFNDLHVFNFDTMVWSRPADTGTVPSPRAGHSANVIQARIYVFAGGDAEHVYNDLHILDTAFLRVQQSAFYHPPLQLAEKDDHHHHPLNMATLSLGHHTHRDGIARVHKSQSAPSSPTHRSLSGVGRDTGVALVDSSSSSGSSRALGVGVDMIERGGGGANNLSMDAVAKLLAAQARDREESDAALLARVDEAMERVAGALRVMWNVVEGGIDGEMRPTQPYSTMTQTNQPVDPRDDSLAASIMRTIRSHRISSQAPLRDALSHAQSILSSEQSSLRQLGQIRRRSTTDDPRTALHVATGVHGHSNFEGPTSVFQALSGSGSGSGSPYPHSTSNTHSDSTGTATSAYGPGHGLFLGPGVHIPPIASDGGAPLVPNMFRSTSADGAGDGMARSGGTSGGVGVGVGLLSRKGHPLTVKPISHSTSTSTLNSPSAVPLAPAMVPPGTPGKARRRRGGNKFKPKNTDGSSNASSLAGTPQLRPIQPNGAFLHGTDEHGAATNSTVTFAAVAGHTHGMSKSSMSSASSSGASISPRHQQTSSGENHMGEIPPRHTSPGSDTNTQ